MPVILFLVLDIALTALALFLSLKQRWLARRRTLVLRSMAIWGVASTIVAVAAVALLGSPPLALSIAGPCVVVLLAALASAAR
ncbi:MAG TPA: hypothetical protein VHX16_17430 [Chloroflexota bacterium]|nr:hypothetical protein [Chloroflexota bacterium]